MNVGQSIFSQLMDFLPAHEFRQCVARYQGDYKLKSFSCWDQFLCMAFAQLTYRESLRDIEACLRANQTKLYHMGIRGRVSRNTLANANSVRDWRIYADFAHLLIRQARALYFLTNNFTLPPLTVAQLYRSRWQVELFFKWIKQHLRIRKFYGTSANALKTQIWIAISIYVLVAIVKKQLQLEGSLYRILQILSVSLFEKTPILEALSLSDCENQLTTAGKQLILFH